MESGSSGIRKGCVGGERVAFEFGDINCCRRDNASGNSTPLNPLRAFSVAKLNEFYYEYRKLSREEMGETPSEEEAFYCPLLVVVLPSKIIINLGEKLQGNEENLPGKRGFFLSGTFQGTWDCNRHEAKMKPYDVTSLR